MAQASPHSDGEALDTILAVAELLADPQLASLYATIDRHDGITVQDLMDERDLAQGTAYKYVNQLVETGLIATTSEQQPRTYVARGIELTVTCGDDEYTITPALVDAVGRRLTDEDIDTYIDRHGIGGLATALSYAAARERGETTHRLMADDLDISPLAAEMIMQALRPVVVAHYDVDVAGVSRKAIEGPDREGHRDA